MARSSSLFRMLLARLFLLRPFLWLLAVLVVAILVSFTFEGSTSYDDRGVGTAAFAVLYTIGLPYVLPASLFASTGGWWVYLGMAVGLAIAGALYIGLDRLTVKYAQRHVRSAGSGAGA